MFNKHYNAMKTISFKQLIDNLIEKGVDSIKIERSTAYCGCISPNDIIAIEVSKGNYTYIASAAHVFDNATIEVDRIIRNENGRCIYRETIKQFALAL